MCDLDRDARVGDHRAVTAIEPIKGDGPRNQIIQLAIWPTIVAHIVQLEMTQSASACPVMCEIVSDGPRGAVGDRRVCLYPPHDVHPTRTH